MLRSNLEEQAADFVMPVITRCGGMSAMRKMANLAETNNAPFVLYHPNGPISTIASASRGERSFGWRRIRRAG